MEFKEIKSGPEYHTYKTWHGVWLELRIFFFGGLLSLIFVPILVWQNRKAKSRSYVRCGFCPAVKRRPASIILWFDKDHTFCQCCGRTYHRELLVEVAPADAHKDPVLCTEEEIATMAEHKDFRES